MRTILVISTEAFGENIRSLRKHLGWSKEEFCRYFELEPWMIERMETGDHEDGFDIFLDSFHKILNTFSLDEETFLFGNIFSEKQQEL